MAAICFDCDTENRPERRFCAACGVSLFRPCATCGFANLPNEAFCGGCGRRVSGGVAARPEPRRHPPGPDAVSATGGRAPVGEEPAPGSSPMTDGERRQLTVMFCDLADSTAMSQKLDPEDLRELNRAYQEAATRAVQHYGGYVARYMGDGVLAYFGYPSAHEDDGERAARAGLTLVEELAELGMTLGRKKGVELHVRVGIATGLVVVGDLVGEGAAREHAVVGETPNLAARLQGVAGPDRVVVDERTRALLTGRFVFEDLGPQALKGFGEPQRCFRVLRTDEAAEATTDDDAGAPSIPLLGRDADLELMEDRWRRMRSGEGQVMLVCADAGFGKTRLIDAFRRRIATDAGGVFQVACSAYHGGVALFPVLEAISMRAGVAGADPPPVKLGKLEAFFDVLGSARKEAVALVASMLSIPVAPDYVEMELEGAARQGRLFDLLLDHLDGVCEGGRSAILIEDLHWADPTTLRFVDRLTEQVGERGGFLVLSYRPPMPQRWSGRHGVGMVTLGKLGRQDIEALATAVIGRGALSDAVVDLVADRTDGVPLFVEELARALAQGDMLENHEGTLQLSGEAAVVIPSTVNGSLMARLDQLGPTKRVAQAAAAVGREFSAPVLAHVLDKRADEMQEALQVLVAAQIVTRRGRGEDAVHAFRQALMRDAAYESLLLSRRRALHARIARALQAVVPDVDDREPAVVAEHYARAGRPLEAVDYYERAARKALESGSHIEAIAHLGAALELVSGLPREEAKAERELRLRLGLARSFRITERRDDALACLARAEEVARAHGRTETLSEIHGLRGGIYFSTGNVEGSMTEQRLSLESARAAGSAELEARAESGLGDAYYQRGLFAEAQEHFARCLAISREHGFVSIEASNLAMSSVIRGLEFDLGRALDEGRRAVELALQAGDRRAAMMAGGILASALLERGEEEAAMLHLERTYDISRRLGSRTFELRSRFFHARYLAWAGQRERAKVEVGLAREAERQSSFVFMGASLSGLELMLAETGSERRELIEQVRRGGLDAKIFYVFYWYFESAIEALLLAGDLDEADGHIDQLRREVVPMTERARYVIDRATTLLAWYRGGPTRELRLRLESLRDVAREKSSVLFLPHLEAVLAGKSATRTASA